MKRGLTYVFRADVMYRLMTFNKPDAEETAAK